MHAVAFPLRNTTTSSTSDAAARIGKNLERARHYLPAQGPIEVFVHHNTLHAFEDLPFAEGVKTGGLLFGCEPFLPEQRYREEFVQGRIRLEDLQAVLVDDLGDEADRLVAIFGTRYELRLSMLQFPLSSVRGAELRWLISESDALSRFRSEVPDDRCERMIDETRRAVLIQQGSDSNRPASHDTGAFSEAAQGFDLQSIESWTDQVWQSFTLNFLWRVCSQGVRLTTSTQRGGAKQTAAADDDRSVFGIRHRDLLHLACGQDADDLTNETLIPLCAAFLDQGFAEWSLPNQEAGFYEVFLRLYSKSFTSPTRWHSTIKNETLRLKNAAVGAAESIDESLRLLGVAEDERETYILKSLLALRGWAGMVSQLETNAEWAPRPAPDGSLLEFLAVRLVLDRIAAAQVAKESLGFTGPLDTMRDDVFRLTGRSDRDSIDQRAFTVYQLAQARGWNPFHLQGLTQEQWTRLLEEIEAFPGVERRRVFHLAYERKYRNETLDAVRIHSLRRTESDQATRPVFQVACCIDEREESFRRHLEEIDPECETFGIAGFFGVAIYYQGANEAHFRPLCPVSVKPNHYLVEQPLYSLRALEQRRASATPNRPRAIRAPRDALSTWRSADRTVWDARCVSAGHKDSFSANHGAGAEVVRKDRQHRRNRASTRTDRRNAWPRRRTDRLQRR